VKHARHRKDIWDIFQILAGLLVPASITVVGYLYSNAMKDAEIRQSEEQASRQEEIARVNARVAQVGVVSTFLDALLSDNPQKRRLAVQAVLIALPEDGPNLVKVISENDSDQTVKDFASETLKRRRSALVEQLNSEQPSVRGSAAESLTRGFRFDPELVEELAANVTRNKDNTNGVYNSLVVLNGLDPKVLAPHSQALETLSHEAEQKGGKTRLQATRLRDTLGRVGARTQ
jgi:hypothetical protein